MRYWIGFDVGKAFHWAVVLDDEGEVSSRVGSRRRNRTSRGAARRSPPLGGERRVAMDLLGGPAALLEAILLDRGEHVFHLPGIAVNRAREG